MRTPRDAATSCADEVTMLPTGTRISPESGTSWAVITRFINSNGTLWRGPSACAALRTACAPGVGLAGTWNSARGQGELRCGGHATRQHRKDPDGSCAEHRDQQQVHALVVAQEPHLATMPAVPAMPDAMLVAHRLLE